MDNTPISGRKISILAILLIAMIATIFIHISTSGFIPKLISDHDDKIKLEKLRVLNSTLQDAFPDVWQDDGRNSFELNIVDSYNSLLQSERPSWQLSSYFERNPQRHNEGSRQIVIYVDVSDQMLMNYIQPTLFFYRLHGSWTLFLNGSKIYSGTSKDVYQAIELPRNLYKQGTNRIAWKIQSPTSDRYLNFSRMHGVSIRSKQEAHWAQRTLPARKTAIRVIGSCIFLSLTFMGLLMAGLMVKYDDLWALSAFCCAMAIGAWTKSSEYQSLFNMQNEYFKSTGIQPMIHTAILCSALALSLTFFRITGRRRWSVLGGFLVFSLATGIANFPYSKTGIISFYSLFETRISVAFFAFQFCIFIMGMLAIRKEWTRFKSAGLHALIRPLHRRIGETVIFTLAIALFCTIIWIHMPIMTSSTGGDMFLLTSIFPVSIIFTQYYWMASSAMRFRNDQASRMDYIDYLALDKNNDTENSVYHGVLTVFDVKGFKQLTKLMLKSKHHNKAINTMLSGLQSDLANLCTRGQIIFQNKTNGDEWIHALYARDMDDAKAIFLNCVKKWSDTGESIIMKWKRRLQNELQSQFDPDAALVIESLDLHVMICILDEMRVVLHANYSRPEFVSEKFTMLSSAFKLSTSQNIAMYREEAEFFVKSCNISGHFEALPSHSDLGLFHLAVEDQAA